MAEVAEAYVSLIPTARGFGRRVEGQIGGDTEKAGKRTGSRFGKVFASASISPLRAFGAAAVGLFAVDKLGGFFKDAVGQASDLNEAGTKLTAIFGKDGSAAVNEFAAQGAKALGQTKLAVLDSAAAFGTFGKAAGKTGPDLAQFSTKLAGLSTDLASFYNTDPSQAAEAIAAGLRGESEPLRQYGILLDDATLRSEALKQGLIKTTKQALTPQQKVLAANAVIFKQSKDAQGDFARTSGGLANQQRILTAQFSDFKTTIGTALLPIIVKIVTALNKGLGPAIQKVAGFIGPAVDTVKLFFGTLTGSGADVGDLPWMDRVIDFGARVRTILQPAITIVKSLFAAFQAGGGSAGVFQRIGAAIAPLVGFIRGQLVPAILAVVAGFQAFAARAIPIVLQIVGVIRANFPAVAAIIRQVMSTIASIIIAVFTVVKTIFKVATVVITRLWSVFGASILGTIKRVLPAILTIIKGVLNVIQGVVRVFTNLLKGNWSGAWAAVKQVVKGAWQIIGGVVRAGIGLIRGVISGGLAAIKAGFSGTWGALKSIVSAAWSAITGAVKSGVGRVIAEVKGLGSRLLSAFRGFNTLLLGVGQDIVQGLVNGIRGAAGRVLDAARHLVDQIPGPIRKLMGIASPSKVMIQIGKFITAGLIKGLEADADKVKTTSAKLADYVTKAFRGKLITAKGRKSITDLIDKDTKRLTQLAKDRAKAGDKLKAAQDKLDAATSARNDYKSQIRSSIIGEGSILGKAGDNPITSTSLIAGLQAQVKATQAFARNLAQLQKLGLNKTTYQQLLEAGVDQGGATVDALLKGGKGAVNQVNSLTKQLKTSAGQIGENGAKTFFQAGVDSARGLVKGLAASAGDLADSAATLAKALVKAVKKALKIKSPSRVFANEVGKQIPAGISMGLDAGQKALDKRVGRLVSVPGLRTPAFAGGPAAAAATGAGVTVQGDVYGATPKQIVDELAAQARLRESLHPVFAA